MASKVSFIIQLQNRFSSKANAIRSSVSRMTQGFDKLDKKVKTSSIKLKQLGKQAKETGNKITGMGKALATKVTLPLIALGGVALVQSAKLETLATAFETMTGSAEKGQKLLQQLTEFTATTPFQLGGVAKATKTLLAFKVPLEDLPDTLRTLGDIAAGTDAPLSDIAQIFGKARAKGKLMTEEILQLAERGIPVIDVLSEKFGVTKEQIFKLASESKISFGAMQVALKEMTREGGIFFNQTKRQSTTLAGLFSTLQDNMALTSGVIGDIIVDVFGLKNGISGLTDFFAKLRERIKSFAKEHPTLTRIIVIFIGILAVLGPVLIVIGQLVIAFAAMAFASGVLGISLSALILPVIAIIAIIAAVIAAGVFLVSNWEEIKVVAGLVWEDIKSIFSSVVESAMEIGAAVIDFIFAPFDLLLGKTGATREALIGFFSVALKSVIEFGKGIVDFAIAPIKALIQQADRLRESVADFFSDEENEVIVKPTIGPIDLPGFETPKIDLAGLVSPLKIETPDSVRMEQIQRFESQQAPLQRSQSDVNIVIKAPEKVIESVKRKNNGKVRGLNVGFNMEPAT